FSVFSRAAGYGSVGIVGQFQASRAGSSVIDQIEDVEAVERIDAIAAVEDIDCLFIGRIDLTVALGADTPAHPSVVEAVERICAAGAAAGRAIGMFVGDLQEIPRWRAAGASLFLLKSDQAFLLEGAQGLRAAFDGAG
ncbi:MAG: aldolase/citrate lyase family protein, partial [Pseudomonadota bacterium]